MFPLKIQWIEGIKKAMKAAAVSWGCKGENRGEKGEIKVTLPNGTHCGCYSASSLC